MPDDAVYTNTQRFSTTDETDLVKLVAEHDIDLGSYVREASNSSLGAGQFWLSGNNLQLVPASGKESAVAAASAAGEVLVIGNATFTITSASTLGATRRVYSGTLQGTVANSGTFAFVHRGKYVTWAMLPPTPAAPDLSPYALIDRLAGKETDRYFSFTNSENEYWPGTMKFFDQTSGVPDNANLIRQPDIADGEITVAVGTPRLDRDPNHYVAGTEYGAGDFAIGQVYYLRDWDAKTPGGTLTLTSAGTVDGTGNARRVYFTATLALTGNELADVQDNGNYWLFASETPSSYQIDIPATDVLGAPWIDSNIGAQSSSILQDSWVLVKVGSGWGCGNAGAFGRTSYPADHCATQYLAYVGNYVIRHQ